MSGSISGKIANGDWDAVRKSLRSKQSKETFKSHNFDADGYNPFQKVCSHPDAPHDVISKMVRIDKDNLFQTTNGSKKRVSPLILACETGSAETVKMLLKLSTNHNHDIVNYVVMGGEGNWDQPKLSSLEVVWLRLINPTYENHVGEKNNIDIAAQNLEHLDAVKSTADLKGKLMDTWDKSVALLWAASTGSMDMPIMGGGWHAIHAITNINRDCLHKRWCPSIVLWFALKLYPEQVKWADKDGNLPLHLAARNDRFHYALEIPGADTFSDISRKILSMTVEREIDMLSNVYLDGVRTQNKEGKLPLHVLAEFGGITSNPNLFDTLVSAAPMSIRARDPVTGLYPFMLKAVGRGPYSPYDTAGVFLLLQKDPGIVVHGTENWEMESPINQENNKMKVKEAVVAQQLKAEENFLEQKKVEWHQTEQVVDDVRDDVSLLKLLKASMASDIKQYLSRIMKMESRIKKEEKEKGPQGKQNPAITKKQ